MPESHTRDATALKSTIACAVRLLTAEGLMDMNGHVSARPGADQVLINSRGAGRHTVRAADIVAVDLRGRPLAGEGDPPVEIPIHTRIYAARPDVRAVAHLHPQFATAFTIAGRPLVPVFQLGAVFPIEGLPVYDDPDLIKTDQEGDAVARALGSGRAVLLRGHGVVVVGEDVETCFTTSIWLEENAKHLFRSSALGTPRVFTPHMAQRVRGSLWQPAILLKTWNHYVAKGRREGVLDGIE
jgi:ribulose-5-phosphate 4-epimerase/fuculose-1-phosphate aldolase